MKKEAASWGGSWGGDPHSSQGLGVGRGHGACGAPAEGEPAARSRACREELLVPGQPRAGRSLGLLSRAPDLLCLASKQESGSFLLPLSRCGLLQPGALGPCSAGAVPLPARCCASPAARFLPQSPRSS